MSTVLFGLFFQNPREHFVYWAPFFRHNDLKAGQFKQILLLISFLIPSKSDDNLPLK